MDTEAEYTDSCPQIRYPRIFTSNYDNSNIPLIFVLPTFRYLRLDNSVQADPPALPASFVDVFRYPAIAKCSGSHVARTTLVGYLTIVSRLGSMMKEFCSNKL